MGSRILAMKVQEAACKVKDQTKALTNAIENPAYMLNVVEMKCEKGHQEW